MCVLAGESDYARDQLLTGQPYRLSDQNLISVIIGEPAGGVVTSALVDCGEDLWSLSAARLMALDGVGKAGAARLLACVEFSRRLSAPHKDSRQVVTTPEDVVRICGGALRGLDREHFLTLALNTKNRLLKSIAVSVGSLNASIVHPRELFKEAIAVSAASVIVVHNHPSGDPTPSGADIQLTRRIVKAGDVLGIEVLDHVVIGGGGEHASLRDMGLM